MKVRMSFLSNVYRNDMQTTAEVTTTAPGLERYPPPPAFHQGLSESSLASTPHGSLLHRKTPGRHAEPSHYTACS